MWAVRCTGVCEEGGDTITEKTQEAAGLGGGSGGKSMTAWSVAPLPRARAADTGEGQSGLSVVVFFQL